MLFWFLIFCMWSVFFSRSLLSLQLPPCISVVHGDRLYCRSIFPRYIEHSEGLFDLQMDASEFGEIFVTNIFFLNFLPPLSFFFLQLLLCIWSLLNLSSSFLSSLYFLLFVFLFYSLREFLHFYLLTLPLRFSFLLPYLVRIFFSNLSFFHSWNVFFFLFEGTRNFFVVSLWFLSLLIFWSQFLRGLSFSVCFGLHLSYSVFLKFMKNLACCSTTCLNGKLKVWLEASVFELPKLH